MKTGNLIREESGPESFGIRQAWNASEVAAMLNPSRLASLIRGTMDGSTDDYLTLCEEMEERDLHYRSVMSTRKHSIEAIDPLVIPGADDEKSLAIADEIRREILSRPEFDLLIKNALDALGKGYSVNEIIWETNAERWRPVDYRYRDPRWFEYDRDTGRQLLLKGLPESTPLSPYKYIIHEPHLKSGLPIRGGIALPVAFYYLIKSYDVTGWSAFLEVFGYPLRIGKYDARATKEDREILAKAVKNLGRDVGAIVPKGMEIEIINGVTGKGNIDLFERLANWCDKQVSKGVLGQTMSTDAEGGQYKGDLHNEVRQEIRESDASQLAATLNRDLIRPFVDLNFGPQAVYPVIKLPVPRPENIPALVEAVEKLVPLGFAVRTDELYQKLGLSRPAKDDEILTPPSPPTAGKSPSALNIQRNQSQASDPPVADELDKLTDEAESAWMAIAEPVRKALNQAASECQSFDEMLEKLPFLVGKLATGNTAEELAVNTFKARSLGDKDFQN